MRKIDIKVGETYYVRVKVTEKFHDKIITRTVSNKGAFLIESHTIFFDDEVLAFSPVPRPAPIGGFKMTEIPEASPKYDPRRKFRKGDKVRSKQVNGRWYSNSDKEYAGHLLTVKDDEGTEDTDSIVYVAPNGITKWTTDPAYLELVIPVEEIERYILIHNENEKYYEVCWKDDDEPDGRTGRTYCRVTYWYHHPPQTYSQKEAKAAAVAERDRMNEEYRKEQGND